MTERAVDPEKRSTLRRFAALGAVSPLSRIVDGDEDRTDVRDAIAGYLGATPGAHFSKLRDDLHLGTGEAQHHLRRLESTGSIESERDGEYRRYFPAARFSRFDKTALGYLRRPTPRGIIIALLRDPSSTGTDIADALSVSRPTVSRHMGDLTDAGLLERADGYRVLEPERLITLLVRYANSFDDAAVTFAGDAHEFISFDP